jgi:hypothetical protein
MVKFHNFHQTVQDYYARGKDNLFPILFECPNQDCPYHGRLRRHGFYQRNVLTLRFSYIIFIQRYLCPVCHHTVSLLPSFLAPRFQYSLSCIFIVLFRVFINHLPLAQIARRINELSGRNELSHQQLVFFKKRFSKNLPLILGFFGSREITFDQSNYEELYRTIIQRIFQNRYLHSFSMEYTEFHAVHFLSRS